ncbi:MAG: sulfatase [Bryobacterales bacterium]|nr:sulfatase [Acidobacteriota bacterium]MCB9383141.1 sulfatase [Bryobacterales bacterium]
MWTAVCALAAGCGGIGGEEAESARPGPNFVVIFLDDVGYGDIQPFGGSVETPQLNRMADEGMKLTSFYAAPVCSPSRAALLTGCYPKRVSMERGSWHAVLQPGDEKGLNPEETTIAELLRERGYRTGVIGKWHQGDQPAFLPSRQGFDYWFGLPYSNDMIPDNPRASQRNFPPLPLMRNDEVVEEVVDQTTLTERYTEEAVRFIEDNADRPFFLYLPHTMAHVPLYSSMRFKGRSDDGVLGDVLMELDWSVGRVLDEIRVNGLERDTLVIFTSDNGPARGSAGPLRGRKGSTFEGGMREPTIAWWPGTIPAGSSSDAVTSTMDLLPTFAALAGAALPADRVIDGRDIAGILAGRDGARSPHEAFFYYSGPELRAVRSGEWKLHASGELYNLARDIGETTDVAGDQPEVVARLEAYLEQARRDLGDGEQPGANVRAAGHVDDPKFLIPRPGKTGAAAHEPVYRGPIRADPNAERPPNW